MHIFIRRLPAGTSRMDLRKFVAQAMEPRWYQLQFEQLGRLVSCDIIQVLDTEKQLWEFHGLVKIEPAKAAVGVIERLNGELLNGKRVEVRKFYRRSYARDRRLRLGPTPPHIIEKRRYDRRRPNLEFDQLHAGTTYIERAVHAH